ncbi:hypothetical protein [Microtetraspora niveoalba]|uniref:hypothetical protein n=1 Tax=Microtetraspora niveoalba TaxID=46175 RepID=UPI00082ECCF3|nr:hypothetical protein [Microtetraspora niveoalba]
MRPMGKAVAWWAALMAVWWATLSAPATAELVTGAACALACVAVAMAVPRLLGQSWRPAPRWAAWLGPLALAVPADTARLLAVTVPRLLRDREWSGSLRRLPPPPGEPEPTARARRALGTAAVSASPGAVVVDWPPDGAPALVHAVTSRPSRLESAVTR